jgi:hypothetical protein
MRFLVVVPRGGGIDDIREVRLAVLVGFDESVPGSTSPDKT